MHIITGLGNPGDEYRETRHNTGARILESLRRSLEFPEWKEDKKLKALTSKGVYESESVLLVFPQTFMNKSGGSLSSLINSEKKAEKLAVIHDDLDLPLGALKISFNRSSGGHRGILSVMRAIKTKAFLRVRVGISPSTAKGIAKKPQGEKAVNAFILGSFKPKEEAELKGITRRIEEALEIWILEGKEKAMSLSNKT